LEANFAKNGREASKENTEDDGLRVRSRTMRDLGGEYPLVDWEINVFNDCYIIEE
jgi:hypothetical protein